MKKLIIFSVILTIIFPLFLSGCNSIKYNSSSKTLTHRDSIDVVHYSIYLDFSNVNDRNLYGYVDLQIVPKFNSTCNFAFDLLKLNVDSILFNNTIIENANYNDSIIRFSINEINTSDTVIFRIYYNGHPIQDPSGWGGFYWAPDAAFNMGVGMDDYPHVYGRTWYPCIDNFTDRG